MESTASEKSYFKRFKKRNLRLVERLGNVEPTPVSAYNGDFLSCRMY